MYYFLSFKATAKAATVTINTTHIYTKMFKPYKKTETHYIVPCKTPEGERASIKIPHVFTQFDPMVNHDGYYHLIRESYQEYQRRGVKYAAFSVIRLWKLEDPRAAKSVAVPDAYTVQVPLDELTKVIEKDIPKDGFGDHMFVRSNAPDPFPYINDGKIHTDEQMLYALEAWVNQTGEGRTCDMWGRLGVLYQSFETEFDQTFRKIKNVWIIPHEKALNNGEESYDAEDFDRMWAKFGEQSGRVILRFILNPLEPFSAKMD